MKVKYLSLISSIVTLMFISPHSLLSVKAEKLERVPDHMEPWTIIKYVEDNKYEVLKAGTAKNSSPNYDELKDECLPYAKKGVLVEYGGDGLPNIIKGVKPGEEHPHCSEDRGQAIVQPDSLDGQIVKGMFTCYNHNIDERGFPLGDYDVATKQDLDNPPYGTTIYAMNLDNKKMLILKKMDVGSLPKKGVVLDLKPKAFKELGKSQECEDEGLIKNGLYFHN